MRTWTEIAVVVGVALSATASGALVLGKNARIKSLIAGPLKVVTEGVQLQPLAGYRWDSHEVTLVIAVKSGCPYCEASMGLYQRIAKLQNNQQLNAYPLVLYPGDAEAVQPEIRDIQRLTNINYAKIGIGGTPTVLLVDSRGKVRRKWAGQLPPAQEENLLAAAREFTVHMP